MKLKFAIAFCALMALGALFAPARAYAQVDLFPDSDPVIPGGICGGAGSNSAGCSGTGKDTISGNDGIISKVANIMSLIAGVVAVFMLIIGGFVYITAGGDSSKLNSGRQIVIYALIGLAVIVVARAIIVFIINEVNRT